MSVLPKVGCRGPLNYTKSGTIVLIKYIFELARKKHKSSVKVLKQKFGKHCSMLCKAFLNDHVGRLLTAKLMCGIGI